MADELELWKAMNAIAMRMHDDADFEQQFSENPASALTKMGLDAEVPSTATGETVKLSALFGKMSDIERRATIDAVIGSRFDPGRVAVATPVANANAAANANAVANANANANANTNTNGFSAGGIRGDLIHVELGPKFRDSELGVTFDKMRLSPARQAALVKSLFSDSSTIINRQRARKGEVQKAIGSYRGVSFEIEAVVEAGEIAVQGAKVIR